MLQMESAAGTSEFEDEEKELSSVTKKRLASIRPSLSIAPRNAAEAFWKGSDAATAGPMTFVSSLFSDQDPYSGDHKSFSQLLAGAIASPTASNVQGDASIHPSDFLFAESNQPASGGGPGLPPRANTARFKSMMPPRLPIPRSPYITIPQGLSPTTLLESPVLLPSGLAEPSPTTGMYFLAPFPLDTVPADGNVPGNHKEWTFVQDDNPPFIFKPHPQLPNSPLASMGPHGLSHQQALAQVQAQANSQLVSGSALSEVPASEHTSNMPSGMALALTDNNVLSHGASIHESMTGASVESSEKVLTSSQTMRTTHPLPHSVEPPETDGYNWRKYGQKQVKGSEYPRSYYKCTHPNCPVKKKVERSYEGHITEYIYRGDHNHPKPQSTRRNAMSNAHIENSLLPNALYESNRADSDKSQRGGGLTGTPEPSLASTSDDEVEDGGDDDSGPKRIKFEKTREPAPNPPLRTIREPRVVVKTVSKVEILDDGYRWRKYGQKVVKGNPYPRSYYKCTNAGCTVRKHVERSSTEPNSVITTYEGRHNHEVPAARNSNNEASVSAAHVVPAPPQPRTNVWGTGERRGAICLQEQLFGKLLEVADMEANNTMPKAFTYNPDNSRGVDGPPQSSIMASSSSLVQGKPNYRQVKPKEEPTDAHSVDVTPSAY